MSPPADNKAENGEFEEDGAEEPVEDTENLDVDHLIRSMDRLKRRGARLSDPAWRRLERYREDKYTEELISDFEDYDVGLEASAGAPQGKASAATRASKKRKH